MKIGSFAEKFILKENEFFEKIEKLEREIETEITRGVRELLDYDEDIRYKVQEITLYNDEKLRELEEEQEINLENIENLKEEILNLKEKFENLGKITK